MARRADKYDLYQRSVQDAEADLHFLARVYRNRHGRPARTLREDFCGTALLACRWVASHRENRSWGIDLDPEPLAWARRHNVAALRPDQARRLILLRGDVRRVQHEPVDLTVAFNFSYFLFDTRPTLCAYFRKARSTLRRGGLFVVDLYGGSDSQKRMTETRRHRGFSYVWDQNAFDPITHAVRNYIHFELPDGSRLRRAFTYDWRLWTIPELRELLGEAGFRDTTVYWENTDRRTNEANGVFTAREHAPDDPAFVAYVVAAR